MIQSIFEWLSMREKKLHQTNYYHLECLSHLMIKKSYYCTDGQEREMIRDFLHIGNHGRPRMNSIEIVKGDIYFTTTKDCKFVLIKHEPTNKQKKYYLKGLQN